MSLRKQILEYFDIQEIFNELKPEYHIYSIAGLECAENGSFQWFDFNYYEDLEDLIKETGEEIAFNEYFSDVMQGKRRYLAFLAIRELIIKEYPQTKEEDGCYLNIWW